MAGAGGTTPAEREGMPLEPHPVKDQLPNISYALTSTPPWPETILLGFQHYLVSLGTIVIIPTVMVPHMGGGDVEKAKVIQTLLFVAGLKTLFQTLFGTRLPALMGASYVSIMPIMCIILGGRYSDIMDPHEKFLHTIRGTQGALILASTLQIVVGFSGLWRTTTKYLSPLAAVPLVSLSGFGLYKFGFTGVAKCIEIGLPQIALFIIFSQYIPHLITSWREVIYRFSAMFSVAIVCLSAYLLTIGKAHEHASSNRQSRCRPDRSSLVAAAPWIRFPYPFQWGMPTFNADEAFTMIAAALVGLVESTGSFIAISRYVAGTPLPPLILSRGIGWQGIGMLLDGLFGTVNGSTVSAENVGLLALTRIGSRRVVQVSAGLMIFFSIFGKFGAFLASIPSPVFAALHCVLFAYAGSAGLSLLQFCNLNSFKTTFILGFSFFMGFSVPRYFAAYTSLAGYGPVYTRKKWINDVIRVIFSSEAFVAGAAAFLLDNTLHRDDYMSRKDRGCLWWDRFRSFKTDVRSEEFYSLPFNLSNLFRSE